MAYYSSFTDEEMLSDLVAKSRGWKSACWDHGFKEFGPQSPYSFFSANLLLTLDTRVVNNSREALLTVSDTPHVAVTIS